MVLIGLRSATELEGVLVSFKELLMTIVKVVVFLAATWVLLWFGADEMDGEYVTGILIAVLYIVAEALHLDPGKSVRKVVRSLFRVD